MDDTLWRGNDALLLDRLTNDLNKKFALNNLGQIHYFLGIEACRDAARLYLTQSKYVTDLLKKHNTANMKPCPTSMTAGKISLGRS